jgi:hypothetical protein
MEFKTFEVSEFYNMIDYAIHKGLTFEATVCSNKARKVYMIEFTGGY